RKRRRRDPHRARRLHSTIVFVLPASCFRGRDRRRAAGAFTRSTPMKSTVIALAVVSVSLIAAETRSVPSVPSDLTVHEWGTFTSVRSEEHTSELQSRFDLVCRLLLEKKKTKKKLT